MTQRQQRMMRIVEPSQNLLTELDCLISEASDGKDMSGNGWIQNQSFHNDITHIMCLKLYMAGSSKTARLAYTVSEMIEIQMQWRTHEDCDCAFIRERHFHKNMSRIETLDHDTAELEVAFGSIFQGQKNLKVP